MTKEEYWIAFRNAANAYIKKLEDELQGQLVEGGKLDVNGLNNCLHSYSSISNTTVPESTELSDFKKKLMEGVPGDKRIKERASKYMLNYWGEGDTRAYENDHLILFADGANWFRNQVIKLIK